MYQLVLNRLRPVAKFVGQSGTGTSSNAAAASSNKLNPLMLQFRRVPELCLVARTKRPALQLLVQQHADLLASLPPTSPEKATATAASAQAAGGDAPSAGDGSSVGAGAGAGAGTQAPIRLPRRPRYLRTFANVGGISGVFIEYT